jgi:hypothetical protein
MSNYDTQEHEYMELKSQFHAEGKFDRFMDEINAKVEARYGLGVDDFADFDFWGYYDESVEEGTKGWEYMVESLFEDYRYELESEHKDFF